MRTPQPKSFLDRLHIYSPGAMKNGARKLSSNENLYGPAPEVHVAIANASAEIWRYPDASYLSLREALADKHQIVPEQIICGVGSDEILQLLARAFIAPDDEIIIPQYGFEVYGLVSMAEGANIIYAHEPDYRVNIDIIINQVTERTKAIFIANPANPTGTYLPPSEIQRLLSAISSEILLVLDEAYIEFVDEYNSGIALAADYPNLVITRTFSKLYGLGGARIGWAYAHIDIINTLTKIRGPFNLSTLSTASALAALNSDEYYTQIRAAILFDRQRLLATCQNHKLKALPSQTNFLTINFGDEAEAFWQYSLDHNFILRKLLHYDMSDFLRITIGTSEDVSQVIHLLNEFMENSI